MLLIGTKSKSPSLPQSFILAIWTNSNFNLMPLRGQQNIKMKRVVTLLKLLQLSLLGAVFIEGKKYYTRSSLTQENTNKETSNWPTTKNRLEESRAAPSVHIKLKGNEFKLNNLSNIHVQSFSFREFSYIAYFDKENFFPDYNYKSSVCPEATGVLSITQTQAVHCLWLCEPGRDIWVFPGCYKIVQMLSVTIKRVRIVANFSWNSKL